MRNDILIRINNIDVKDYIRMRFAGLPTSVKWRDVKDKVLANDMTLQQNCITYKQQSYEVLYDEPSQETLKEINKIFNYGINC